MAEVEVRGLDFHFLRLGGGEPTVVFLHGLVMDNLSSWYFTVANPMARGRRDPVRPARSWPDRTAARWLPVESLSPTSTGS